MTLILKILQKGASDLVCRPMQRPACHHPPRGTPRHPHHPSPPQYLKRIASSKYGSGRLAVSWEARYSASLDQLCLLSHVPFAVLLEPSNPSLLPTPSPNSRKHRPPPHPIKQAQVILRRLYWMVKALCNTIKEVQVK
ncbi:hypothetical protein E2C01_017403 [Portunus trituberculatus]|uniref:Uncharacterized protein n=1 Tax=Portunus trituberculatus TaxID=210409 RepID=A0A5B7DTJ9_PORTR|nr:hypothetical protein [Portunus trituberculatus]